jgi:hypothetical protein
MSATTTTTEIQVSAHPYLAGFILELNDKCYTAQTPREVAAFVVRHGGAYFCDDTVSEGAAATIARRIVELTPAPEPTPPATPDTTTTTRRQPSEAAAIELLPGESFASYRRRFRDQLMGNPYYMALDFDRAALGAVMTLWTIWAGWSTRHILPPPAAVLPRRATPAAVRLDVDRHAEAQAVEAVLLELATRTEGTRAEERYRRALAALEAGGVVWADAAGGLEVTRGATLHQVHPEEGCSCRAGGWRCYASAIAEAVEIVAARAVNRRPGRAA